MAKYYQTGEGADDNPYASDLWIIYDSLMEAFGLKNGQMDDGSDSSTPNSIEDLEELLERLEDYEEDKKKLLATKTISELFEVLSDLYEEISEEAELAGFDDDEELPVTVGDLETIYKHISIQDDDDIGNEFEGRNRRDSADTVELTILFNKLSEHYYTDEDLDVFENGADLSE